jgi:anti-sigma regulatory factor (Ser/Thr protein kinase)
MPAHETLGEHPRRGPPMTGVVELTIPVQADLVVLARLTAATVASRADFDVEEIEDLRLAVDELCVSLVQGGGEGRLDLQFSRDDDRVEVSCSYHPGPKAPSTPVDDLLDGLSARILDALVDEHGEEMQDGRRRAWLRMRRAQHRG